MNYRFENEFTEADSVTWKYDVDTCLDDQYMSKAHCLSGILFQFGSWCAIYYYLHSQDLPFYWMAPILFISLIATALFYTRLITPLFCQSRWCGCKKLQRVWMCHRTWWWVCEARLRWSSTRF